MAQHCRRAPFVDVGRPVWSREDSLVEWLQTLKIKARARRTLAAAPSSGTRTFAAAAVLLLAQGSLSGNLACMSRGEHFSAPSSDTARNRVSAKARGSYGRRGADGREVIARPIPRRRSVR